MLMIFPRFGRCSSWPVDGARGGGSAEWSVVHRGGVGCWPASGCGAGLHRS